MIDSEPRPLGVGHLLSEGIPCERLLYQFPLRWGMKLQVTVEPATKQRHPEMAETDRHPAEDVRQPELPLPEESGLSLEEYLAMQQAMGHPTRFRILRTSSSTTKPEVNFSVR